ncbi:MAG: ABC transporter ATP-binding protein [Erysipelotrichaceae bacterium]|nr:ABC transporter ATP-binding protein [Erysipelotrichaceae bacterium]
MLEFKNVKFIYKSGVKEPILENLSFKVEDGEFISIVGSSGSGKTTIFRILNGLEDIQEGSVEIDGQDIRGLKNYSSYMPQKDLLLPWKTIEKNVMLPMSIQKVDKDLQKERAIEMLKQVGLEEYANKYPKDLSGGMRQRVAFARTLCAGANLLLLDEPFSALDYITRISLQEWLMKQWLDVKKTIVFITHDVEEAIFLSEKIYVVSGRPITDIEIKEVDLPYPRTREMLLDPRIQRLKEDLIDKLRTTEEEE